MKLQFLLLAGCLCSMGSVDAQLQRWVDEQGRVHYSNIPPPDSSYYDRHILDRHGMVREIIGRPPTPEELAIQKREQERQQRLSQLQAEQRNRDRVLLMMFSTERDIELARTDRLTIIETNLMIIDEKISEFQTQLAQTIRQIEGHERDSRQIPEALEERRETLKRWIREHEVHRNERARERDEVKAQFDADLQRFRELQ